MVQRKYFLEKKCCWGKNMLCSKWTYSSRWFFLSIPLPSCIGLDERWINPSIVFLKPSLRAILQFVVQAIATPKHYLFSCVGSSMIALITHRRTQWHLALFGSIWSCTHLHTYLHTFLYMYNCCIFLQDPPPSKKRPSLGLGSCDI